jgi:hypothetical protein
MRSKFLRDTLISRSYSIVARSADCPNTTPSTTARPDTTHIYLSQLPIELMFFSLSV